MVACTKSQRSIAKVASLLLAAILTCAGLTSCSQEGTASEDQGAVAATVGGEAIYEDDVTQKIESFRQRDASLQTDEGWASWVAENGGSPEEVRGSTIDSFAEVILVEHACEERGIAVTDDELDTEVATEKERYARYGEGAFESIIAYLGYSSKDQYREDLRVSMLANRLKAEVVGEVNPTEEQLQSYVDDLGESVSGKHAEALVFDSEAKARTALARIQSGSATFDDIIEESGQDADRGWSCVSDWSEEFDDIVQRLDVGELSEVEHTASGYELVRVVDEYDYASSPKAETMPQDLEDALRAQCAEELETQAWEEYGQTLYAQGEVEIMPMPEGLSYDVDMSLAEADDATSENAEPSDGVKHSDAEEAAGEAADSQN